MTTPRSTTAGHSLAERLGYPAHARLLIVTSDDLGFTHSVNAAFIAAIDAGLLTSGSVMVPCPWFAEIAAFGRARPDVDLGIHLTLTCETDALRWGPVLGAAVPSLRDADGAFPRTEAEVLANLELDELAAELAAQLRLAREAGVRATHLDSHMGVLYQQPDVYQVLLDLAATEGLPVRHPRTWMPDVPHLAPPSPAGIVQNDHLRSVGQGVRPTHWMATYEAYLSTLPVGVTELVLHVGRDDDELRAAYDGEDDWGAAWRQRDLEAALDPRLADLAAADVVRIGWGVLAALMDAESH